MENFYFHSLNSLIAFHGKDSAASLARLFYKITDCGVSLHLLNRAGDCFSAESTHYPVFSKSDNDPFIAIKLSTIIEGSEATVDTDPLYFPFSVEDLQNAVNYLEEIAIALKLITTIEGSEATVDTDPLYFGVEDLQIPEMNLEEIAIALFDGSGEKDAQERSETWEEFNLKNLKLETIAVIHSDEPIF